MFVSRAFLFLGVLCALPKNAAALSGSEGEFALVLIAQLDRSDAYCTAIEHELVQNRLMAAVQDDSDDSDDRRILMNEVQCQKKCSGFPLGYKDSHCWLIYPKCKTYTRRAMTGEGEDQVNPPTLRRNVRARQLDSSDSYDFDGGFVDTEGKWSSWKKETPDAQAECTNQKNKIERTLPFLQYERKLSKPCKLLIRNHEVGCINLNE